MNWALQREDSRGDHRAADPADERTGNSGADQGLASPAQYPRILQHTLKRRAECRSEPLIDPLFAVPGQKKRDTQTNDSQAQSRLRAKQNQVVIVAQDQKQCGQNVGRTRTASAPSRVSPQ